jgi:hypothetical protein
MQATIRTELPIDLPTAAAFLRQPATMIFVARPLVTFTPLDPPQLPETWTEGRYRVALRLFGIIPFGRQAIGIRFEQVDDPAEFIMRDQGGGGLIRVWDHRLVLQSRGSARVAYTDQVDIQAGLLTPLIWAYAHLFFRWRQYRWRRLIRQAALRP